MKQKTNQKKSPVSVGNELERLATKALHRAAQRAREDVLRWGTPIYIWKNGRVVAIKP